ncbi:U11/U12 small nuclear ribonucleoprotein 25 kDa protein-like isoform X1 [Carya illinoinensis]|uniref:SNRNP25 ubiquitin-like domain-containing protein n=1 Tax=Carya illinoinensis TaxID=32201 RepID=A0A8T1QWU8_CARIL|nr:U11/U12 small nuclear ribonucleoprotein 25 kDa protein-like isoform X1 [Carya illinoinensis]KAG6658624.1 hypothetical protein CIPAW_04G174500 [Carya illinoinensis]
MWASVSSLSVWKSFAYRSLPQQPLKLSVHKLDGSCFELFVARTATIAELKEAVEEVFGHISPDDQDREDVTISWYVHYCDFLERKRTYTTGKTKCLVWSHFCLCYKGQKLVDDKAYIRLYGIKDEDQLYFVRHLSINDQEDWR